MKKLLSVAALASMLLVSLDAYSRLAANGENLNGLNSVVLNGVHPLVTLRGLAQAPLVKAN